jgi:hypothetical protein
VYLGSPFFGSPFFGSPFFGSPFFGSPFFGSPFFGSPFFGSPFFGSPFSFPMICAIAFHIHRLYHLLLRQSSHPSEDIALYPTLERTYRFPRPLKIFL